MPKFQLCISWCSSKQTFGCAMLKKNFQVTGHNSCMSKLYPKLCRQLYAVYRLAKLSEKHQLAKSMCCVSCHPCKQKKCCHSQWCFLKRCLRWILNWAWQARCGLKFSVCLFGGKADTWKHQINAKYKLLQYIDGATVRCHSFCGLFTNPANFTPRTHKVPDPSYPYLWSASRYLIREKL